MRLRASKRARPFSERQRTATMADVRRLRIAADVDPLGADVLLLPTRGKREASRVAVRRVDQLDATTLGYRRTSCRATDVRFDREHPAGPRVAFHLQIGQSMKAHATEGAKGLVEHDVVAALLPGSAGAHVWRPLA